MAIAVRSVNHRHLQVQCRMPHWLQELEPAIRSAVRGRVHRGHVTVSIDWIDDPDRAQAISVDTVQARALQAAAEELATELGLPNDLSVSFVLRQPGVVSGPESDRSLESSTDLLEVLGRANWGARR